jgi:hypothetical protein
LFVHSSRTTIISNLGGIYSYILGTIVYAIFFEFLFDNDLKSYGLLIPISLTTLGFNINILKDTTDLARSKVLIITNIMLLFFWSVATVYLLNDLEQYKRAFEDTKEKFALLDSKYLKEADSIQSAFVPMTDFKLLKELKNDTLEKLIDAEFRLYSEFRKYRAIDKYVASLRQDYMYNYQQIRTSLVLGLIIVVLLNVVYLIYLRR